jgi:hypothetical protein
MYTYEIEICTECGVAGQQEVKKRFPTQFNEQGTYIGPNDYSHGHLNEFFAALKEYNEQAKKLCVSFELWNEYGETVRLCMSCLKRIVGEFEARLEATP